ncbi:uncharacterized protein VTP21DRAFT_2605 [Calcarisporiella thermophila]|uniref:uncharacterized protein n=1 Tax=Calcarisporiella thermophila TaxID=911321 RepID=UPI003742ABF0
MASWLQAKLMLNNNGESAGCDSPEGNMRNKDDKLLASLWSTEEGEDATHGRASPLAPLPGEGTRAAAAAAPSDHVAWRPLARTRQAKPTQAPPRRSNRLI